MAFTKRVPQRQREIEAAPGRFVLTVAHLDRRPRNCQRSNLRALCTVCHLRYDAASNAIARSGWRYRRREKFGQLKLFTTELLNIWRKS